jgi:diadenosine tetraphosphatase ApaH/serine/threonine PP2A family protein phosphatase
MDFSVLIQQANDVKEDRYISLIDDVGEILRREASYFDNATVNGKLINLKPVGEALVIGDLHGDVSSLCSIIEKSHILCQIESGKNATLVFLGDYGDRGPKSPELYYLVLSLKLAFPGQVILLRGNHEGPSDLMASPHDLPIFLQRKFKENWVGIYQKLRELFDYLSNAVYVEDRYLMVHGGLPSKLRSIQEIANADRLHPGKSILEELLWNDPDEKVQGVFPSPRGAGCVFGRSITQDVLKKLNVKILIRGHEPVDNGYQINHDGKILTLFSRKGPPYHNDYGTYLELPLVDMFENANQLIPYIHDF